MAAKRHTYVLAVWVFMLASAGCDDDSSRSFVTPTATSTASAVPTATGTPSPSPTATSSPAPITNLRALHDPVSARYDEDCLKCHGDVLTESSLDPTIVGAHPAMLGFSGGFRNEACPTCHAGVDFDTRSAANVRRNVDVGGCYVCHRGPAKPFYSR